MEQYQSKAVILTDEIEEVSGPKDLKSNFRSLNEWLFNACDSEHPQSAVEKFNFGLFESPDEYIVFFVGMETEKKQDTSISRIVFEPENMYYLLQKNEYENLSPEEIREKIKTALIKFTSTQKFETSFFAQAKSIKVDFAGEIWSK